MTRSSRIALTLIVLVFATLATVYNATIPLFEGPDELFHFFYIRDLVEGRGLPVIDPAQLGPWGPEGNQPPLYYALVALVVAPIDLSGTDALLWTNPQGNRGDPLRPGNKNILIHTAAEDWPYQGVALAVHLGRVLGLLFGAATILGTYASARLLFGDERPALVAAAINALLPQFVFMSALLSNDVAGAALAAAGLYLLLRLVAAPGDRRLAAALGIVLGLAALVKLGGLLQIVFSLGALALVAWRDRAQRATALRALLIVAALALIVAGWWYARSWLLYGDPTGQAVWQAVGARGTPPEWWAEFRGLRWSFLGLFGWFSIPLSEPIYWLADALTLLALAGLAWRLATARRRGDPRAPWLDSGRLQWALTAGWVLVVAAALVRWNLIAEGFQGRLLFPALSALCILLVAGWRALLPPLGRQIALAAAAGLALLSATVPAAVLAPAYARPPAVAALPDAATAVDVVYAETIRLLGYQVADRRAGDWLDVTLYWQAAAPVARDYQLALAVLGQQDVPIGKLDSYPGFGTYPLRLWRPGEIIADRYRIRIESGATRPAVLRLRVGWWDGVPAQRVPSRPAEVRVDVAKLAPDAAGAPLPLRFAEDPRFGPAIALAGFDLAAEPGAAVVTLEWAALARPGADYTVFVHVYDASGTLVAQADNPPVARDYPTSWWDPGERIRDVHRVAAALGPGAYTVEIGLYDAESGERLPASGPLGDRVRLPQPLVVPQDDRR
jgi:4-amino-4-deoxy-L-arabinose transferase-like glycosyltransferase